MATNDYESLGSSDSQSSEEEQETTDEPGDSSAAQCIQLDLLDNCFRPEFTHQCFDGEWIRGYQPETTVTDNVHASYRNHKNATHALSIRIQLAPSCLACAVDVNVTRVKRRIVLRTREDARKRARTEKVERQSEVDSGVGESSEDEDVDWANGDHDDGDADDDDDDEETLSDYEEEEEALSDDPDEKNEGATRKSRMPVDEIMERLSNALPTIVTSPIADEKDYYLRTPPGSVVEKYKRGTSQFCLTIAEGKQVVDFHKQVQRLAIWFIETADEVDVSDDREGDWKVLYLLRQHSSRQYSLVGYTTLYSFNSPFRKPLGGTVVRICQTLVLPPYQRSGHGREMLLATQRWSHGLYNKSLKKALQSTNVVEVNVEDPAPGFVALRNRVDYEQFVESTKTGDGNWLQNSPAGFVALTEAQAMDAAAQAKTTVRQIRIVHEIHKLNQLRTAIADEVEDQETLEKSYRLMVKKRLNKEHKDELSGCKDKREMQAMLTRMFDEVLRHYDCVIDKVKG